MLNLGLGLQVAKVILLAALQINGTFLGPLGTTVIPTTHGNDLAWTASSTYGVTYNLYRGLVMGGPYTKIQTGLTGLTYHDSGLTPGTPYYYVVTSVNGVGESAYSDEAEGTPL